MAACRYEISLLVLKKYFTRSLCSLVEKFRISAQPCNILYFVNLFTLELAKVKIQDSRYYFRRVSFEWSQ